MKQIDVSSSKHPNTFATVSDEDFARISARPWKAIKSGNILYAKRIVIVAGKKVPLWMHHEVLGIPNSVRIDHRDGNGLNNQRENLRKCTHAQNMRNRRMQKNNTSGYVGVTWIKRARKWKAQIKINGIVKSLGRFTDPVEAARVRDEAARHLHEEFSRLNFPSTTPK